MRAGKGRVVGGHAKGLGDGVFVNADSLGRFGRAAVVYLEFRSEGGTGVRQPGPSASVLPQKQILQYR